jgi:hypothetical protein
MSLVLDAWIKAHSPAITIDQLVLLHVSDELQTPNGATVQASLPTGDLIDPPNQHQNVQARTGGGFRSLRDLGTRIWPDSRPDDAAKNAGARIRRLRGLPNPLKQAYFPALLWTVQGGRYQDTFTGQVLNRREVWRIPILFEAVLVPVPVSGRAARREGWTAETGWQRAEDLLLDERQRRFVSQAGEAAAAAVRAAARDMGYVAKATEHEAAIARHRAEGAALNAWDEDRECQRVQEYLEQCRVTQERVALGDIETADMRPSAFIPGAYAGGGEAHGDHLASIGRRAASQYMVTAQPSLEAMPGTVATDVDEQRPPWESEPLTRLPWE